MDNLSMTWEKRNKNMYLSNPEVKHFPIKKSEENEQTSIKKMFAL